MLKICLCHNLSMYLEFLKFVSQLISVTFPHRVIWNFLEFLQPQRQNLHPGLSEDAGWRRLQFLYSECCCTLCNQRLYLPAKQSYVQQIAGYKLWLKIVSDAPECSLAVGALFSSRSLTWSQMFHCAARLQFPSLKAASSFIHGQFGTSTHVHWHRLLL